MMEVQHDKHAIWVREFRLRWTYDGYLAGSRAKISALIRSELDDDVRLAMPNCGPVVVIDKGDVELPEYLCMAHLISDPPPNATGADGGHLLLCWFVSDPTLPIWDMVVQALPGLDWEKRAAGFVH